MTKKLVAQLVFSPALRESWPSSVLTAEAHLKAAGVTEVGPWSMRAELWQPPDADGRALAWVSFLSPEKRRFRRPSWIEASSSRSVAPALLLAAFR